MTNLLRESKRKIKEQGTGKENDEGRERSYGEVKIYSGMVYSRREKGCSALQAAF